MAAADYLAIAQKFYVAYFGRPADPSGLANMTASLDAAKAPATTQALVDAYATNTAVRALIDNFGNSDESRDLYGGDSTAFVIAIYNNVLGRAPDAEGLAFWAGAIASGALARGSAALTIMAGAENNASSQGLIDAATVSAKVALAAQFSAALSTPAALASYAGNAAAAAARALLSGGGSVSTTLSQLVDPVPGALDLALADDTGNSSNDKLTRVSSGLTMTGMALGAAQVEIYEGSNRLATGKVTNGLFSIDITLGTGNHTITAKGITGSGNPSRTSSGIVITVDATPPAALTLALESDSGIANDLISNIGKLVVAGSEPLASVQYSVDGITWTSSFSAGAGINTVQARQVDAAGNVSPVKTLTFTYDTKAPVPMSSVPSQGATGFDVAGNIVLVFDEAIRIGSGDIILSDGGADVRLIAVGDSSQVQLSGKTLTIDPALPLQQNTAYTLTLPSAALNDVAGNAYAPAGAGIALRFTSAETVAPLLLSSTPSDTQLDVAPLASIYLTFNEAIKAGSGHFILSDGAGDTRSIAVGDTGQVSISGDIVTIKPTLALRAGAQYSLQFGAGVLKDLAGNSAAAAGAGAIDFSTASASLSLATLAARSGYQLLTSTASVSMFSTAYAYTGHALGVGVAGVGDINADGMDDFIVVPSSGSAYYGYYNPVSSTFLVYGNGDTTPASIDVTKLDSKTGMRLDTTANTSGSKFARAAAAGDVNGDGRADLLISDHFYATSNPTVGYRGTASLVYGQAGAGPSDTRLSALNGSNGYHVDGVGRNAYLGRGLGAGDINGDGLSDLVIGAPGFPYGTNPIAGVSYILFGSMSAGAAALDPNSLNGLNGLRIDGEKASDGSGMATVAGDFNGDGYADVAIGADGANKYHGAAYLVFGKPGAWSPALSLSALTAGTGLRITNTSAGNAALYGLGDEVSAVGDVNGDGYADLLLAAPAGGSGDSGTSFVVFGRADNNAGQIDVAELNGKNGFRITGHGSGDYAGLVRVAAAGDFNGDGFDDVLIGAPGSDIAGLDAGAVYVVFGKASGFAAAFDVSSLGMASAWRIDGATAGNFAGTSVSSAGDVNGDGFDDIVIGAPGFDFVVDSGSTGKPGAAYIVYGRDVTGTVRFLGGSTADTLTGTAASENFVAGNGNDTMVGGGGADAFSGGAGNDIIVLPDLTARRIDGGSGSDTLRLSGAGQTLDLALFRNRIDSIETIDLSGSGNNTLKVLARDLLNLNELSNILTVNGNGGDQVVLGTGWTDGGIIGGYHQYVQGQAVILVGLDLTVTL